MEFQVEARTVFIPEATWGRAYFNWYTDGVLVGTKTSVVSNEPINVDARTTSCNIMQTLTKQWIGQCDSNMNLRMIPYFKIPTITAHEYSSK